MFFATSAFVSFGQTIVSTSPESKNIVLEEFTAIHCGYCPLGHAEAKAIQDANPDRVFLINIHTGSLAIPSGGEPDFRTPYGSAIVAQTYTGSSFGIPSGTINRHVFPGRSFTEGGTMMFKEYWAISANETMAELSNVNIGVEASIDINTNVLTVHVEGYYTASSPTLTNHLNVALLQNNTTGPQNDNNGGNSTYLHMHRLVEMITGQWGEAINNTTANTFVDRTYTYPIPSDFNAVPTEITDMEVVAYITNTHQEIPSGSRTYPTFTGMGNSNDANLRYIENISETCSNTIAPKINVQNFGQNPVTSLDIEYIINGALHTFNWTGNILPAHNETIELDEVTFNLQASNTIEVILPNDDDNGNNQSTINFNKTITGTGTVYMELNSGRFGFECTWNLKDGSGNIIYSGGPYNNWQTINETFQLSAGCYQFNLLDHFGNGGDEVSLTDSDGTQLFYTDGNYGVGVSKQFSSNGILGVNQSQLDNISLYPNPTSSILNLKNAENANIQVYDVLGKLILSKNNISMDEQVNVEKFQVGTYFMKISLDNLVTTKRFVVSQ